MTTKVEDILRLRILRTAATLENHTMVLGKHYEICSVYAELCQRMQADGLMEQVDVGYRLTEAGCHFLSVTEVMEG